MSTPQIPGATKTVVSAKVLTSDSSKRSSHPGLSTDIVQIESIEVKPNPPKPGQDLTIIVKASTSDTIEVAGDICVLG
jgi:hypothetical protein